MKIDAPFIHLFKTPLGFYLYDVNTGQILKIDKRVYNYLANVKKDTDEETLQKINILREEGFLKNNRVEITEHPYTELLPFALQTRMGNLILQVTQNCNLRCEYCIYSGNYKTRGHSNTRKTFYTAKKAIDFLIQQSKERHKIFIGFYGGEPLLEFELIKKCVKYADEMADGKEVVYVMTTNATLLSEKVIDYMIEHQFKLTISVDGPREIHNRSRVFANKEEGSYDIMMRNIKRIKEKSESYYQESVQFNTVMLANDGFSCLENYFHGDELFSDSFFSASTVSSSYAKSESDISDEFLQEQQYELFKSFLGMLHRLDSKHVSILLDGYIGRMKQFDTMRHQLGRREVPAKWHRGGPCIPIVNRAFVTAEGNILPCERVCEIANISKLGTIEEGIDIGKAQKVLNLEKYTEDNCHNCWAYAECTTCIQCCDSKEDNISENILKCCKQVKHGTEEVLKDCAVLKELGYDFESDSLVGEPEVIFSEE